MFETWGPRLGITEDESDSRLPRGACTRSSAFDLDLQDKGRAILETVEAENRIAILVVGRPYHADPGLNHGIPEEFQVLGYPILSIRSIPKDREYLDRYFKEELESGTIKSRSTSTTCGPRTTRPTARRRCGRRSSRRATRTSRCSICRASSAATTRRPTASSTRIVEQTSQTPYAALHDIDANKPGGSIKIRVKTYAHSLKLHEERLEDVSRKKRELARRLDEKRLELLR